MVVVDTAARTLELLSLLQTHRAWSGDELAARLEVSPRTLRRDVDRLRSLGYPVDATPGVAGGYRLAAGAHLPPLMLDDEEAVAIAVGLRAAAGASIDGIEDTSLRALAKLEQVLPDRLRRQVAAVHGQVSVLRWGASTPTVAPETLVVLTQGCRDGEQVRFDYAARTGEETRRLVEPHRLVSVGRRWYLVAWDVRREDWRTFRLDRMTDPRLAGVRFEPRRLPVDDPAEFVAQSLAGASTWVAATVRVRASEADVRRTISWADAQIVEEDDGVARVELRAESTQWLAAVVAVLAVFHEVLSTSSAEVVSETRSAARRLGRVGEA